MKCSFVRQLASARRGSLNIACIDWTCMSSAVGSKEIRFSFGLRIKLNLTRYH